MCSFRFIFSVAGRFQARTDAEIIHFVHVACIVFAAIRGSAAHFESEWILRQMREIWRLHSCDCILVLVVSGCRSMYAMYANTSCAKRGNSE